MSLLEKQVAQRIEKAVAQADTTRAVVIGSDVLKKTPGCFKDVFGERDAIIVADPNTFAACGKAVQDLFIASGKKNILRPFILEDEDLYGDYRFVQKVREHLAGTQAIAVAVGSGTINDLVKLASHECGRPYMAVGTAASMDGYTSFGAAISKEGFKHTRFCPAPTAVVADISVIAKAPEGMNAWGYADLLAKVPAGADWIVADALGIEPISEKAWSIVQAPLRGWVGDPDGIRTGDHDALINLSEGLMMSGLAMQATNSSRPASGAEHQFSHLWDGQHHTHNGGIPPHGYKVAIGSLCSEAIYAKLLELDGSEFVTDNDRVAQEWPTWAQVESLINSVFEERGYAEQVIAQSKAKYLNAQEIVNRRKDMIAVWPKLQKKLKEQLFGPEKYRQVLKSAGAISMPEEIGISVEKLRQSCRYAQLIRSRYTVLDLALETGLWGRCVDGIFEKGGFWKAQH